MIGKILALSDTQGQVYVADARASWRKQGYEIIDEKIDDFKPYNVGIVLSREKIYEKVWREKAVCGYDVTVRCYIKGIRKKMWPHKANPGVRQYPGTTA